ncbi:mannitol-1-phosphate 5-dehydrogenase [Paenibacillus sp. YYML68]|uniref:mannitol-1-phosphate 5-dehydrogenase n=1 Tax=Paenibacillus sp. YYML68 TaxID=2909250 RepID=UPI00248FA880|nr:mannitol-1-phosphate 5-dehydrogenase [Paenibacillus sp. YYML68]
MKKAVHFGAGNIGRGFIGLLLNQSGYEVCFVDVNDQLVEQLIKRGAYTVTLANEDQRTFSVNNVTAVNGKELDRVAEAVAAADLVTTAVGVSILKAIAPGIARGLELRAKRGLRPLPIIACENAIGGSTQLKEHVHSLMSEELQHELSGKVAFPDAAVDRIVPLQQHDDPLHVRVEPFFEWAIDRSQMLEPYEPIEGVHYVDRLEPYIERKLFTVNTGHCCAAYMGYVRGYETIQQSMADPHIAAVVKGALQETGAYLVQTYGFDAEKHAQYIETIMQRFTNPYLIDEVIRVGRSPIRKLSPNDRLVRPATLVHELGVAPAHLSTAMAAALLFDVADDPEAVQLMHALMEQGVSKAFSTYTSIPEQHPVHAMVMQRYAELKESEE